MYNSEIAIKCDVTTQITTVKLTTHLSKCLVKSFSDHTSNEGPFVSTNGGPGTEVTLQIWLKLISYIHLLA